MFGGGRSALTGKLLAVIQGVGGRLGWERRLPVVERVVVIAELVWSGHLLLPPTARRNQQARRDSGACAYGQRANAGDEVHWFAEKEVGHAGKSEQKSTNRVGDDERTAVHDGRPAPFRSGGGVAERHKQSLREPLLPAE